ncbi:MAG TPA: adenylate/guanylate cyclase domain-containing protein [Leptospiraceae bacterium]|nr:adenylate/guanylate cyclase domain-containing protein [Leptospiraceae bacterium]HMZ35321.1 adenylate/guanylate cyclase domain-containing protein [Leptospiraceae bacterium]HNE24587.1 adenylate/guanylate cyclase domain-containing protein [Leptospiraceae bacterium]HNJ34622.1 adenylate/guanylate cyclase domain-containing protein [Leptospiraceae bacterium]HNL00335.1 adenylate/guanylate cyclase domain-containing protein [Leptospiraceae bacterium]
MRISKIWSRLSQVGVSFEPDPEERKRIILVNKTSITVFLVSIVIPVVPIQFNLDRVALAQFTASFAYLLVPVLNSFHRFFQAKLALMIFGVLHIGVFAHVLGEVSATHFFIFAPALGAYVAFSPRDWRIRTFCTLFSLAVLILLLCDFAGKPLEFKDFWARIYYYFSLVLALVLCLFLMHHLYSTSMEVEGKLAEERKRSDELLLNILPAKIAEELKESGAAEPVHFDSVTIVFTDFQGFTRSAESMPARELVRELDEYFRAFDEICERFGLERLKTIGDSFMCAAGVPEISSDHAIVALRAALAMRDYSLSRTKGPRWGVRIGVHSGPVVAGVIGRKKFAYDLWGDTVNTASRMESSGEPGAVNCSEATKSLAGEVFTFESRGKIEAKGKAPMEMFFCLGEGKNFHSLS